MHVGTCKLANLFFYSAIKDDFFQYFSQILVKILKVEFNFFRETVDLCQKAEHAGVSWIAVHGRTKDQRAEPVNKEAIKTIKESLSIPVIANGDIKSLQDVEEIQAVTKVDGVMAARGILQNPAMYSGFENTPLQCVQDWVKSFNTVRVKLRNVAFFARFFFFFLSLSLK